MYTTRKKLISPLAGYVFFLLFMVLMFTISSSGYIQEESSGGDKPGANEVFMEDDEFVPESKTVAVGTTIKWINKESEKHNVISGTPDSPSGLFKSGKMKENDEFTYKFTKAGTFTYFCSYHEDMTGTIIVK
jgi:plastocyanin